MLAELRPDRKQQQQQQQHCLLLHCVSIVTFYVHVNPLLPPYCMCLEMVSSLSLSFPRLPLPTLHHATNPISCYSQIGYEYFPYIKRIPTNLFLFPFSHRHPAILQIVDALSCRLWPWRRTTAPCIASRRSDKEVRG